MTERAVVTFECGEDNAALPGSCRCSRTYLGMGQRRPTANWLKGRYLDAALSANGG